MTNRVENDDALRNLLQSAMPPTSAAIERDLWPRMLRRLDERHATVAPFDWALIAALLALLAASPSAIPILLYQL